ncbi:MAG: calcium-binding protein [Sulfuritalea sp.]|nr:calcium-binding protein [Sulfuritalea sp.]
MAATRRSSSRERRIESEIVVDAYTAEERALGWYYYVEERLGAPLMAQCISARSVSPLRKGEHVEIIGMAAEDDCRHELYVRIRWSGRTLAVPLAQLRLLDAEADAVQAVEDWHYWVAQHYEF